MRLTSASLLILAPLCITTLATGAEAQDPNDQSEKGTEGAAEVVTEVATEEPEVLGSDALVHNTQLLDELLTRSTEQTIREQKFAAAAGMTGGMILLGLSAWRLIEDEPQNQYTRGLGVMFMTLGMVDLTTGVYAATRISHEKRRLDRWQKALENGITDVELAHFEGELQASHEQRQGERLLVRWNGLTHALGGLLVIAFAPIADSTSGSDRVTGYVIGGVFFAIGMATFAASFRDSPSEKAWNEYNSRKTPMPGREFTWGIAPSISRRGGGVSFGGLF
jgi:hypothetical protein